MGMPTSLRTSLVAAAIAAVAITAGATGVALAESNSPTSTPSASADQGDGKRPGARDGKRPGTREGKRPGAREGKRPGTRDGDRRDRKRGGKHGHGMLGGRALHGEFVVPDRDGGFRTLVSQRGEATEVSASEITVRSEDGFTTTYAVTEDTLVNAARDGIETIEKGSEVHVVAAKDGDAATALRIGDRSAHKEMRKEMRKGMRKGSGLDGPAGGA